MGGGHWTSPCSRCSHRARIDLRQATSCSGGTSREQEEAGECLAEVANVEHDVDSRRVASRLFLAARSVDLGEDFLLLAGVEVLDPVPVAREFPCRELLALPLGVGVAYAPSRPEYPNLDGVPSAG